AVRAIELFTSKAVESIIEGKKDRISKELLEQKAAEEAEAAESAERTEDGSAGGVAEDEVPEEV
ncbi:MAG: 30S ribosomal protein S2, partial [Candidatus Aminicenantes bacterium]|nr:30S ribosomal protein S2 [Candidatus Aminicenantes bacterium]